MRPEEVRGAGIIVTGAGRGIGAALAAEAAARGGRVVLIDRDESARSCADEVGGHAIVADLSDADQVREAVEQAIAHLGTVDLLLSNAGIAVHGGLEASDEDWQRSWDVNVMAHVRLIRGLLPHWRSVGTGHAVITVSAAGLLMMPMAAAYTTTKHAAEGLAEWLAVHLGLEGITVQSLCPRGVLTDMVQSSGPAGMAILMPGALTAESVAATTLDALGGPLLILPHPEVSALFQGRAAEPDAWISGSQRLVRHVIESSNDPRLR